VGAARQGILAEAREPSPGPWFADGMMSAFSKAVGFDGYCMFGVDPLSGLRTVMFSRHGLTAPTQRLLYNETVERDANRYADLASGPTRVGILAAGGAGEPKSHRLHEMLRPDGYTCELRVVLTSGGRYWGAVSLFRTRRSFTDNEVAVAAELVEPLSVALRRYQIGTPGRTSSPRRDGIVTIHRDGQMLVGPEAAEWLSALAQSWPDGAAPEDVERAVLETAHAARRGEPHPTSRVRMPGGGWLTISAVRISQAEYPEVAVLRAGDPATVTPAFAAWCGLTNAEGRVLQALATGAAAKHIARSLEVSPLTVNDHLAAVYRKAGVRGRNELLSLLS
jgi:DNA-binding CsgD family transcriptional regulator